MEVITGSKKSPRPNDRPPAGRWWSLRQEDIRTYLDARPTIKYRLRPGVWADPFSDMLVGHEALGRTPLEAFTAIRGSSGEGIDEVVAAARAEGASQRPIEQIASRLRSFALHYGPFGAGWPLAIPLDFDPVDWPETSAARRVASVHVERNLLEPRLRIQVDTAVRQSGHLYREDELWRLGQEQRAVLSCAGRLDDVARGVLGRRSLKVVAAEFERQLGTLGQVKFEVVDGVIAERRSFGSLIEGLWLELREHASRRVRGHRPPAFGIPECGECLGLVLSSRLPGSSKEQKWHPGCSRRHFRHPRKEAIQ